MICNGMPQIFVTKSDYGGIFVEDTRQSGLEHGAFTQLDTANQALGTCRAIREPAANPAVWFIFRLLFDQ